MSLSRREFFAAVSDGLIESEYTARLLDELEDHLEDAAAVRLLSGNNEQDALIRSLEDLGDPNQIKHEFNIVMKFKDKHQIYLEALFVAVLSLPWYLLAFFWTLLLSARVREAPLEIWPAFSLYAGWLAVLIILYSGTMQKLVRFVEDRQTMWQLTAILIGLPLAIFMIAASNFLSQVAHEIPSPDIATFSSLGPWVLSFIFLYGLACVLGTFHFGKKWMVKTAAAGPQKTRSRRMRLIAGFLGAMALCYIAFTTVASWLIVRGDLPVLTENVLSALSVPRVGLELGFLFLISGVLRAEEGNVLAIWTFGLLALALTIYCAAALVAYFRKRQAASPEAFPWLKTVVLFYALNLLFLGTTAHPNVVWHVPVREVSARLEQQWFGPFYRFNRSLDIFTFDMAYEIFSESDGLKIQLESAETRFVLADIEAVDNFTFQKETNKLSYWHSFEKLPDNLVCAPPAADPEFDIVGTVSIIPPPNAELAIPSEEISVMPEDERRDCVSVSYDGQLIYTMERPYLLKSAKASPDGRFLLLILSPQPIGSDFVYLVDLRPSSP